MVVSICLVTAGVKTVYYLSGLGVLLLAGIIGSVFLSTTRSASADPAPLTYTAIATHPQAAAQPTATGKTIKKLQVYDNKLFAGYGDYTANTGPIAINPLDLSTNTFDGTVATSPTEEIHNMRIIDGKLYMPMLDPTGSQAGYVTGDGSSWSVNLPTELSTPHPAVHIFDVASYGGSLWLSGVQDGPGGVGAATLWRSTDGGTTWQIAKAVPSTSTPSGFERFYWMAVMGGKLYAQAMDVNPTAPVMSYDGTSWEDGTTQEVAPRDSTVVTFAGKIVTQKGGLSVFDGTTLTNKIVKATYDLYVGDDGYLYVLFTDHTLVRTNDLSRWQNLGSVDGTARSIAEHDGYVYLGTGIVLKRVHRKTYQVH